MRNAEVAQHILQSGKNPSYLGNIQLDTKRLATYSGNPSIPQETDVVVVALPAAFSAEALSAVDFSNYNGPVISAAKGLIPEKNLTVTEWLEKSGNVQPQNLYMIGGPCHSEEVALDKQSYLTLGGNGQIPAVSLTAILNSETVGCSGSGDLRGIELAAVLKNVMALACGMALGTGRGDNFLAVLVSAAARETEQFLQDHFPAENRDINASAYLGDLLVTCFSPHSRNRSFGLLIGRGYSTVAAKNEMAMVAEGYYAIKGINARFDISAYPIMQAVYASLYQNVPAQKSVGELAKKIY